VDRASVRPTFDTRFSLPLIAKLRCEQRRACDIFSDVAARPTFRSNCAALVPPWLAIRWKRREKKQNKGKKKKQKKPSRASASAAGDRGSVVGCRLSVVDGRWSMLGGREEAKRKIKRINYKGKNARGRWRRGGGERATLDRRRSPSRI
jgi:hypothetical protein